MSSLNKKQVIHIAEISNLKLTDSEIDKFTPQLSKVVEYVDMLNEVDTKDTKPTYQVVGLNNIFHEDSIDAINTLNQDKALSNTNSVHNGFFKVKAILEGRTDKRSSDVVSK